MSNITNILPRGVTPLLSPEKATPTAVTKQVQSIASWIFSSLYNSFKPWTFLKKIASLFIMTSPAPKIVAEKTIEVAKKTLQPTTVKEHIAALPPVSTSPLKVAVEVPKGALDIPLHHQRAFALTMTDLALTGLSTAGVAFPYANALKMAVRAGITASSTYDMFRKENIASLPVAIGVTGALVLLDAYAAPLSPFWRNLNAAFTIGTAGYNIAQSLSFMNESNRATVARNTFVYSVNAFTSAYDLKNSFFAKAATITDSNPLNLRFTTPTPPHYPTQGPKPIVLNLTPGYPLVTTTPAPNGHCVPTTGPVSHSWDIPKLARPTTSVPSYILNPNPLNPFPTVPTFTSKYPLVTTTPAPNGHCIPTTGPVSHSWDIPKLAAPVARVPNYRQQLINGLSALFKDTTETISRLYNGNVQQIISDAYQNSTNVQFISRIATPIGTTIREQVKGTQERRPEFATVTLDCSLIERVITNAFFQKAPSTFEGKPEELANLGLAKQAFITAVCNA